MTKISVFGEEPTKEKELKKIEFVKGFYEDSIRPWKGCEPHDWDNIMLIGELLDFEDYDAMLVWDNDSEPKNIVLGRWNDGVV